MIPQQRDILAEYAAADGAGTATSAASTIIDYLNAHDVGFDALAFTPVDSLVLSSLSYLDMDCYAYANVGAGAPVPLIDILRFSDSRAMLSGGWIREARELDDFLTAVARCRRFADLSVSFFSNETAAVIEKQFCACTFTVGRMCGAPHAYIAFRGTDGTIAGWKEDFNLSFRTVIPSQRAATRYVSGVLSALPPDARVLLGGHSKGGNLAEYAAATIDEAGWNRIEGIYNHDGPSFLSSPTPRIETPGFKAKLHKTVPESSVFGMMLERRDDYRVVRSDAMGLFQHNPFTWLVDGDDFAYQDSLNASAVLFDQTLDRWLRSCTPEQRELFIDTVYELISSSDATSWQEFQDGLIGNVAGVLRDGRKLDPETKDVIYATVKNLGSVASAALRERVGEIAARMRSGFAAPQADGTSRPERRPSPQAPGKGDAAENGD